MARRKRLESPVSFRVATGLLSVMLHLGLCALLLLSGGRHDGVAHEDTPISQLVFIESPKADRRDGIEPTLPKPAMPAIKLREQQGPQVISPPSLAGTDIAPDADADHGPDPVAKAADEAGVQPVVDAVTPPSEIVPASDVDSVPTFIMPQAQATALLHRIERYAEKKLKRARHALVSWNQRGTDYNAELVLEPSRNGIEADRVVADISAENRGRQLKTRIVLRRVSYSQFTEIVDSWNPMVQLHEDEVDGPMHINSEFNVLSDSMASPALLGKVTTAARRFHMETTDPRNDAEVFREGIQTRAGRISLPGQFRRLEMAPTNASARVHQLATDTRIQFLADGSYGWGDSESAGTQFRNGPSDQPVYFLALEDVTLYVQGVVAGKILVYSPRRIVIEGNLTYAHDPRAFPDSGDYLGLVSERDIEVAPAEVTGPGDMSIHAAMFARRRFVVTDLDHTGTATLRIFGSVAVRSITASEPRYAMRIEYDKRFEDQRPPGFPAMNRYAAENWDQRWTEVPATAATSDGY